MLIKIDTLEIFNFGIFRGKTKLDFRGKDIIGILAEYADDKERSNRAGKSLILESIKYNLVGTVRAKKEVQMIHTGMDTMYVEAVYSDSNGKTYRIKRGRSSNGEGVLELDWIEKSRETQQAITDIFGVSAKDFELTNFFKQADINGFMDLSPSEKTKYLMKWVDNSYWEEINKEVKEDIKDYKIKLRENEAVRKSLEEALIIPSEIEVDIELNRKRLEELEKENEKLNKKFEDNKNKYHEIDKKIAVNEQKVVELNNKLRSIKKNEQKLKNINKEVKDLKVEIKEIEQELKEYSDIDVSVIDKLEKEYDNIKNKIKINNEVFNAIKNAKGICPVLNKECSLIEPDQSKEDLEKEKSKLKKLLKDKKEVIEDIYFVIDGNKRIKELNNEIREYNKQIEILSNDENAESVLKSIKKLENTELENKLDELQENGREIKDCIRENKLEISKLNRIVSKLEEKLSQANDSLDKMTHLEKTNRKLRLILEDLNYINMMTGKNGIPSEEIENAFGEVQDDINYILKEVDSDLTISFSPDRELSSWEAYCHCGFKFPKGFRGSSCPDCGEYRMKKKKEEISLKIIENGIESDFGLDSGGGKTIVSFAVRIALTMLKRRQNKSKLNIMFLDEVDSALDGHFWKSIIDVITRVLTKTLGYDQILMISHKEEIKNAIPHIVKVTRYSDYSKAEFL